MEGPKLSSQHIPHFSSHIQTCTNHTSPTQPQGSLPLCHKITSLLFRSNSLVGGIQNSEDVGPWTVREGTCSRSECLTKPWRRMKYKVKRYEQVGQCLSSTGDQMAKA